MTERRNLRRCDTDVTWRGRFPLGEPERRIQPLLQWERSLGCENWDGRGARALRTACDRGSTDVDQPGARLDECDVDSRAKLQLGGFDILGEGMNHTLTQLYVRKAVAVVNIT